MAAATANQCNGPRCMRFKTGGRLPASSPHSVVLLKEVTHLAEELVAVSFHHHEVGGFAQSL
jgi:hypothetical protein